MGQDEFRQVGLEEDPAKSFHLVPAVVVAVGVAGVGHIGEAELQELPMNRVEHRRVRDCWLGVSADDPYRSVDVIQQQCTWAGEFAKRGGVHGLHIKDFLGRWRGPDLC